MKHTLGFYRSAQDAPWAPIHLQCAPRLCVVVMAISGHPCPHHRLCASDVPHWGPGAPADRVEARGQAHPHHPLPPDGAAAGPGVQLQGASRERHWSERTHPICAAQEEIRSVWVWRGSRTVLLTWQTKRSLIFFSIPKTSCKHNRKDESCTVTLTWHVSAWIQGT